MLSVVCDYRYRMIFFIQKESREQKKPLADKIRAYHNYTNADDDLETYRKEQMPGKGLIVSIIQICNGK